MVKAGNSKPDPKDRDPTVSGDHPLPDEPLPSILSLSGLEQPSTLDNASESAWIEVIHKMDSVYADLVRYQVELEEKNSALELAQQSIASVLSSMTDVLIVCDTRGRIQQVNAALQHLTGIEAGAYTGKTLAQVFGADSDIVRQFSERLGSEVLIDCVVNVPDAEGTLLPLAINCASHYDQGGALSGMVLIGRPIGELKRAYDDLNRAHRELKQTQQQLVHAEKMASLGRLVAGVAHELNNPISFVFGNMHALKRYGERLTTYLEAVAEECDSPRLQHLYDELRISRIIADINPLIDGTLEGAERVSVIVQDLRRYSGGQHEDKSSFDLCNLVRKAVQWVSQAARRKLQVEYQLPAELVIHGCKGKIHQILVNLVQNAIDAMANLEEPQLQIHCEKAEKDLLIHVSDCGPGIPEADLPRIFDPFFTSKPVGQGTGLGLYISYGLARELGGELLACNQPGGGARFTLRLSDQAPLSSSTRSCEVPEK